MRCRSSTVCMGIVCVGLAVGGRAAEQRGMSVGVDSAEKLGIKEYHPERHHALIIAINDYRHWTPLSSAVNDGREIANILKKKFAFGDVKLLINEHATREAILEALDSCLSLGKEDSLVIYYAGHGWMDPKVKTGYWVPVDARRDHKFDYVANSQIVEDYFKKFRVKHLFVMADSCFSGTLLRGMAETRKEDWKLPAGYQKPSRWVMTSGDLAPVLDNSGSGHSPFASRVIQYLGHSDAPAFGVQDLYVYVRKNLNSEAIAQPMRTPAHMPGGEFVFCRLARAASVATDPSALSDEAGAVTVSPVEILGGTPVSAEPTVMRSYLVEEGGLFRKPTFAEVEGGRFRKLRSGVIYDRRLRRSWRIVDISGIFTWRRARELIREELGDEYRLPCVDELKSLVTKERRRGEWARVNADFFPRHTRAQRFWTDKKGTFGGATCVDLFRAKIEKTEKDESCGVLAISRDEVHVEE